MSRLPERPDSRDLKVPCPQCHILLTVEMATIKFLDAGYLSCPRCGTLLPPNDPPASTKLAGDREKFQALGVDVIYNARKGTIRLGIEL